MLEQVAMQEAKRYFKGAIFWDVYSGVARDSKNNKCLGNIFCALYI